MFILFFVRVLLWLFKLKLKEGSKGNVVPLLIFSCGFATHAAFLRLAHFLCCLRRGLGW